MTTQMQQEADPPQKPEMFLIDRYHRGPADLERLRKEDPDIIRLYEAIERNARNALVQVDRKDHYRQIEFLQLAFFEAYRKIGAPQGRYDIRWDSRITWRHGKDCTWGASARAVVFPATDKNTEPIDAQYWIGMQLSDDPTVLHASGFSPPKSK